jgi:hypothetical protein
MSDGVSKMFEHDVDRDYRNGVAKIAAKKPEEIYLLLKDIHSDIQHLAYDDHLVMTRNQFASINRIHNVVKELLA